MSTLWASLFFFFSFLFFNELRQHFEIVGHRCSCYRTYEWLLWSMSGPLRVKRHAAQTYFVPEYLHLFPVAQNKKFTGDTLPFLSTWCNLKIGNELCLRLQGINIKAYSMLCSTCFSILFYPRGAKRHHRCFTYTAERISWELLKDCMTRVHHYNYPL